MPKLNADDLVGLQEIAALMAVTTAAVSNWRTRFLDFPRPIAILAAGPVFHAEEVGAWLKRRAGKGGRMNAKTTCFVIGPIGDELAPIGDPDRERWEQATETWEKVIEPACVELGLVPVRADKIAKVGEITEQVFRLIRDSDLVIADVTGGNPNVMYELGLRHTLEKSTLQIGEYGKLPFDVSAIRTLMFTRTPAGFVDGRKKLQAMLTEVLENGSDPVTATRLWNMLAGPISAPLVDEENSTREVEEPGVFELLAEMEGAFPQLNALTDKSTQAMQKMTALAESATADLHTSDAAKGGFAGRLRIANRMATQLSPIADEFEEVADGFEQQIASIDAGMSCLLDLIEENPAQLKEMGAFPEILQTLVTNIRTANKSQAEFAAAVSNSGKFSRPMRVSSRRIADATKRSAKALEHAEVWSSRLQQIANTAAQGDPSASA
jgi:hypothetical protein